MLRFCIILLFQPYLLVLRYEKIKYFSIICGRFLFSFAQDRLSLFISIGQISMSLESYWIIENVYVWNIVLLVIYWMITISYVEEIEEMSV